jgi:hypothetical protein
MRLPGWTPRNDRDEVSICGTAVLGDGRSVGVHLTDLSMEGCRVVSTETLLIGQRLDLRVEGFDPGPVSVRWALNDTAGLRFEDGGRS